MASSSPASTIWHPLSSVQREIWFDQALYPEAPVYNITAYLRIQGALDRAIFQHALTLLVQETDVLRMKLTERDNVALQAFPAMPEVVLGYRDLSNAEDPMQAALIEIHQAANQPFRIFEDPVFRFTLYKLSDDLHLWLQTYHHLVMDGASGGLMVQRLASLYNALLRGEAIPDRPGVSYLEFVESDAAYLASDSFERHRRYWQAKFSALPEPLFSPKAGFYDKSEVVPSGAYTWFLSRAKYAQLEALADGHSVSVFHALLGLFYVLFTRMQDRDECVIGLPVLNRNTLAFKQTIGLFASVMPSRFSHGTEIDFIELMQAIAKTLRENYRYQRFPGSEVNRLAGVFQAGRKRLFDLSLSFIKQDYTAHFGPGAGSENTLVIHNAEQLPLAIYVGEYSEEQDIQFDFSYNLAYFDSEDISRIEARFRRLLDDALEHPERSIGDLDILPEAERQQLLVEWNSVGISSECRSLFSGDGSGLGNALIACPFDRLRVPEKQAPTLEANEACVHELFEAQVRLTPDATAVVFEEETLSYAQLNARANQLAHTLIALGIGPDDRVAIGLERSPGMIVALVGTLKAGGAYVPLDPSYPAERLAFMREDCRAKVLITQEALMGRFSSFGDQAESQKPEARGLRSERGDQGLEQNVLCLDTDRVAIATESELNPPRRAKPENLAYVIYTSGSTGRPKGVAVEQASIAQHCQNICHSYDLRSEDRVFQFASLSFDTALEQILPTLCVGAGLVLPKPGHLTAEELDASLRRQDVSVLDIPPAFFPLWASTLTTTLPPTLRLIIFGGEVLPPALLAYRSSWPKPWPRMINAYGPTEATITATLYDIPTEHPAGGAVPIGRPMPGRRIYVLDRHLQPVPIGVPGELFIGGRGLARGYLGRPELTTERFIADPFGTEAGERLYRTGDKVRYRADGNLEFLGRMDRQVKIRGFRIEPEEIEGLLKTREDVEEAVITHDSNALFAHIVLRGNRINNGAYDYHLMTVGQQPSLEYGIEREHALSWPAFFAGDKTQARYWRSLYQVFPDLQFVLMQGSKIAAVGNLVPLCWDGTSQTLPRGWDEALEQAFRDQEQGRKVNTLCVLVGVVSSEMQGRKLSYVLVSTMARIARSQGFRHAIIPVRPTMKSLSPEMALRDYAAQTHENDGSPLDPWLRVHHRIGGRILAYSECSQTVEGTVEQWRTWTGLELPESGDYFVEGALQPVHINIEEDRGLYFDQSIWVEHDLSKFGDALPSLATPEDLRGFLSTRLPAYMVPSRVRIIEKMPLTPNGKVDRRALAELEPSVSVAAPEAPRDAMEEILVGLWATVLRVPSVGVHGNFFELGGHSLLATQLASRIRDALGVDVPVRWLFEVPTVAELGKRLHEHLAGGGNGEAPAVIPANCIQPGATRITPEILPLVSLSQEEIDQVVYTVEGGAANVQDIYPLAPLQEGILFHHQLQKEGDAYLGHALLLFDTPARCQAFLSAFQSVIDRHDILRTAVVWEKLTEPVQVVWRKATLPVETLHFDPAQGPIGEQLVERRHPRHTRLDLTQAPMLRVTLAKDGDRILLHLLSHHLTMDHTTQEVFFEEIMMHLQGQEARLQPPVPFRDFAMAARTGVAREVHEAFFRDMLGDIDTPTAPFGLLDVQGDGSTIVEAKRELPAALAQRLRTQSQHWGATPAALCHLAWALVLSRCSEQDDVVFGTVLFGRLLGGKGVERALGLFMNTLPIRITCDARPVAEALRETQRGLLALMGHEQAPLSLAQRCSAVPAPTPLFSALLNYRHSPTPGGGLPKWEGIEVLLAEERSNFPFALSVDDQVTGFGLTAQVDASVNPARLCDFMQCSLEALVAALEAAPQTPLCELDILPSSERQQLLRDWNSEVGRSIPRATDLGEDSMQGPLGIKGPTSDVESSFCVHELFEAQVVRTPEATALVFEEETLSYAELNRRANQLAHALIKLGVGPDDRVAIALERSPGVIIALLAVLKAGGAYVPLDPDYPSERLAFMRHDCGAMVLITQESLMASTGAAGQAPDQEQERHILCLDTGWAAIATESVSNPTRRAAPGNLAYVIYTSGSTGKPKGVAVEHRGLGNLAQEQIHSFGLGPDSRVLQFASFSFDASIWEVVMALCAGARLCLPNAEERMPGPSLGEFLNKEAITHLTLPPTVLANLPQFALPSLECLIVAGEQCPLSLASFWSKGRRFFNAYGPTETTVCATIAECAHTEIEDAINLTIGRPLANTQLYVLDGHLRLVPIGVPGELHIGGIGLARGYLNRPELTAEKFIPNPFSQDPGARLYKTGDLARYRPDGNLEFLGRLDHQVKIRGFRIELGEIEAALVANPSIREAVVVARNEESGDQRLVAYLVAGTDTVPTIMELRSFLKATLPEHMVPAAFVWLPALPLTPNGKVDRKALPEPDNIHAKDGYCAPRDGLEQQLVRMWEELLSVRPIGIEDNFFESGGHSLLAVRLVAEIERRFGNRLPLGRLFEFPTIAGLAALLRKEVSMPETSCLVKVRSRGTRPPLFFLPGAGGQVAYLYAFAGCLDSEVPFYAFQAQALDGKSEPFADMEMMAAQYVSLLRGVQPQGPYYLAGHSSGGSVAYAIAQLLLARGETIGLLALVDAFAPGALPAVSQEEDDVRLLYELAKQVLVLSWKDLEGLDAEKQFAEITRRLEDGKILPGGLGSNQLRTFLKTYRSNARIAEAYTPTFHTSLPITLIRASEAMADQPLDPVLGEDLGWGRYSSQPVAIHYVPGDHMTMMRPPHVTSMAQLLGKMIC